MEKFFKNKFAVVLLALLLAGCSMLPDNSHVTEFVPETVSLEIFETFGVIDIEEIAAVEDEPEEEEQLIENDPRDEVIVYEEPEYEPAGEQGAVIWAAKDLEIYSETGAVIGTMAAGTPAIVVSYDEGEFRTKDGYVNASFCMINLPDYLGDLAAYNITNSYCAVFSVCGLPVDGLTDTVIPGYDNVQTDDEFYVPLIFPAARKLLTAAKLTQADGLRLKIYDTYRPYSASRYLYETMNSMVYNDAGNGQTYYELMTDNGKYLVNAFLAKGISTHNYGVALDLTLEDADGNELEMQTAIHDLSGYSATDKNNDNANLLRSYMTKAGFGTLFSEWWHFQDNDTRSRLASGGVDAVELRLQFY